MVSAVVDIQARQGQVGLGDALATGLVKEVNGLFQVQIKATRRTAQQYRQVVGGRPVVLAYRGLKHVFELGDLLVAQLALQGHVAQAVISRILA